MKKEKDSRSEGKERSQGLIGQLCNFVGWLFAVLVISLALNIAVEWLGMALGWWSQPGAGHAMDMLVTEAGYISGDFRHSILGFEANEMANWYLKNGNHYLLGVTGMDNLWRWFLTTDFAHPRVVEYALAAGATWDVFLVRLSILTLTLPTYALAIWVGVVAGLAERDIRRANFARESAGKYGTALNAIGPSLLGIYALYLSMPVSIHPVFFVGPGTLASSMSVFWAIKFFKKYM